MNTVLALLAPKLLNALSLWIASCAIVWIGGPYIAIDHYTPLASVGNRLWVILALFVFWAAKLGRDFLQAKKEAIEVNQANENLTKHFQSALQFICKTDINGQKGKIHLAKLPWYLLVGTPSSGKSSLLHRSGLKYILSKKILTDKAPEATRNCDWWVSKQAVFLDTNGQYAAANSRTKITKLWQHLLNLIAYYHPRQKPEGILLVISIDSLINRSKSNRQLKQRLKEIHKTFGNQIPIHIVLTKLDRLQGFQAFFQNLDAEEREQLWGIPLTQQDIVKHHLTEIVNEGFAALLTRLNQRIIWRLHQELNVDTRDLIKDFPIQLETLQEPLVALLHQLTDSLTLPINLQGVFFTSVLQSQRHKTVDQLLAPITKCFDLHTQDIKPRFARKNKTFFVKQLLSDRLLMNNVSSLASRHLSPVKTWLQRGTLLGSILVIGLFTYHLAHDFSDYITRIHQAEQAITEYKLLAQTYSPDTITLNQALQTLNTLSETMADIKTSLPRHTWMPPVGQHSEKTLMQSLSITYEHALQEVFLPALANDLATEIQTAPQVPLAAVKVYLMLGTPSQQDKDFMLSWLSAYWKKQWTHNTIKRDELEIYLKQALSLPHPATHLQAAVIQKARLLLAKQILPPALSQGQTLSALPMSHQALLSVPSVQPSPPPNRK